MTYSLYIQLTLTCCMASACQSEPVNKLNHSAPDTRGQDLHITPKEDHFSDINAETFSVGTGSFYIEGGLGKEKSKIEVHYYRPANLDPDSKILLVIPGAGRNSDDYRDAWVETAKSKNILVAALGYSEKDYDFAAYHLGGVVENLKLENLNPHRTDHATIISLRDEDIKFDVNPLEDTWMFHDFDRVFETLKSVTNISQDRYDIFGHSAGGQILHRLAIFNPNAKTDRIIAANSGFYTLPDATISMPSGLKNTGVKGANLRRGFAKNLTLLLGENDNGDNGGTMLHTPMIDKQGLGRFQRGHYFYHESKNIADEMGAEFNWKIKTVANTGHDFRAMTVAASEYLYP